MYLTGCRGLWHKMLRFKTCMVMCLRKRRKNMYERMLDKQNKPTIEEMTSYCGENAEL